MKSKDKFEGKFYLSYRDRIKKRTYYLRNTQAVSKLLLSLQSQCGYSEDYTPNTNSDIISDMNSDITPYKQILDLFHHTCPSLPTISILTSQCKKKIHNLWTQLKQTGKDALHTFQMVFTQVEASDFLCGRTPKGTWRAILDWILQPKKFFDILSGKYAPFSPKPTSPSIPKSSASVSSMATSSTTYTSSYKPKSIHSFLRMENHNFDLKQLETLERLHQQRIYEAKLHNLPTSSL